MEDYLKRNPAKSHKDAHDKTRKATNDAFYAEITDVVKKIADSEEDASILFIDKNHPPEALDRTVEHLDSLTLPKSVVLKTIAVLPELSEELERCPFSVNFILKCYLRVRSRTGHQTFNGDDPFEAATILFSFMKAFKNFQKSSIKRAVDSVETFDFVDENNLRIQFP